MEQAEEVFGFAKACNEEEGGFKAEGLDDSKVGEPISFNSFDSNVYPVTPKWL